MNINLEGLPAILEKVTLASLLPALLYLLGGMAVVKIVMRALTKALEKSSIEKTLHKFILTLIRLTLYFIVFMTVAGALGIQITSFVAILSVAGLAISLSLQGVLSNLSSGVMLLSVKPFKAGDYVELGGVGGTVREIGFIHTKISTPDNKIIYIPNSEVSSSKIVNYTNEGKRRIDLVFSAGYNCPIETVKLAIREAVEKFPKVYADPAPFVRASAYKDSVIEYTVRVWCGTDDYWDLYYDIIEAVSESYARHGVEMSYPHVNVHMAKD
ncbi:MAG: mechanosensitive ion channel [Cloacibacillus porcorum]|uniref:mechanosensitive ion channel family protein n=1 Tax=Cloacibacillus porcorum TaxID=1197717 RepID=UPI0023531821|nr:mechanosensitive ion channel domain-containing protein [Cloacibacillus porcorum]MCI5866077.1 mechanosensitive ion channel [Cloacibacillus porcorum]MDD7650028.1 mechanosensitive ion channel [Cloacibacillus porcorum]MDY4094221.1 mechanosensitive ion channel [Cloacibacillus porcorum]